MDIFEKSRASELFTSLIALTLLCAIAAPGQVATKTWTLQHTPDGQPDLEGYLVQRHHYAAGTPRRAGREGILHRAGTGG